MSMFPAASTETAAPAWREAYVWVPATVSPPLPRGVRGGVMKPVKPFEAVTGSWGYTKETDLTRNWALENQYCSKTLDSGMYQSNNI